MLRWGRWLMVVLTCSAGLVDGMRTAASTPPGLIFTDTSEIVIPSGETTAPVTVELCNTTDEAVTVQLRLAGFRNAEELTFAVATFSDGTSLSVAQPSEAALQPGGCVNSSIAFAAGSSPAAASGELLAVARPLLRLSAVSHCGR